MSDDEEAVVVGASTAEMQSIEDAIEQEGEYAVLTVRDRLRTDGINFKDTIGFALPLRKRSGRSDRPTWRRSLLPKRLGRQWQGGCSRSRAPPPRSC